MQTQRPNPDRLYQLVPEMYRDADAGRGYPLRALLRLIGGQVEMVRGDIQQLWDNFFAETCEQWAVPYIGDLVSNQALHDIDLAQDASTAESLFPDLAGPNLRPISPVRTRADVAKTIYYRRRKGTTAMLEELAGDVTSWGAHVVEFFQILTWTQNMNHFRLASPGCAKLHAVADCAKVGGPFDNASHMVDVRAITQSEGWYNVPNLGFFLWRLISFPVIYVRAREIGGSTWRFTFSPLGNSAPLFACGDRQLRPAGIDPELLVPEPIPPYAFFDDLAAWNALPIPRPDHSIYYGDFDDYLDSSIAVYEQAAAGAGKTVVDLTEITCVNLSNWTALAQPADNKIGIDVKRGRLIVGSLRPPSTIFVSYRYGFSANMGGGPYPDRKKWTVPATSAAQVIDVNAANTLDHALATWAANPTQNTIIRITDSDTHTLSNPLTLDSHNWLVIQAESADPGYRPHIQPQNGMIEISGANHGTSLTLIGLLIEGGVQVDQDIDKVRILHCTLVPGRSIAEEAPPAPGPSVTVSASSGAGTINAQIDVEIAFSICGPLRIPETVGGLWLLDSIVDGGPGQPAISNTNATNGPLATIERSTILGTSLFRKFDLCSDTIFTDIVTVEDCVAGCLRFCFVPPASQVPQQYHCQPSFEVATEIDATKRAAQQSGQVLPFGWDTQLTASIQEWLVPSFETIIYGLPQYCQLRLTAPVQIRAGASDGAEMGAFNQLKQPQRETNLRIRLGEYVPFGRSAGIIYVT